MSRVKFKPTPAGGERKVDMQFEIVVIPVSDVDRAKEFYARLDGGSTPTTTTVRTFA